ncbi:MAG TPA: phosphatase PAP2 family protein [Acidimicrobiales bacterium]|nr:phosphatase PAP2 family protein [Acidimicrobiales bacterium]
MRPPTTYSPRHPVFRLGLGGGLLVAAGAVARRGRVGPTEEAAFRAVNGLPDALAAPVWVVMQAGNLVAVPAAAVVAAATGHPDAARRMAAAGAGTWTLAKVVKGCVRRSRPARLLAGARERGRPQSGDGFASGHAGVAFALCTAALPELTGRGRRRALATAAAVAASRLYVGAHLPLDVVGGAALGVFVEAAVELAMAEAPRHRRGR